MNICTTFVTNSQSSKLMQPTDSTFDYPAINAKPATMLGIPSGYFRLNTNVAQCLPICLRIIGSVCIKLLKAIARSTNLTTNRRNGINQFQQLGNIMLVGRGCLDNNGNAIAIRQNMMLRTWFSAIYRARAGFFAPPTARTVPLSTMLRSKSIWSAFRKWFSRILWIVSHSPAFCQSRNLRQHVMPLPQPISRGNISQGMPERSTNIMPVKQFRGGKGLRPGWYFLRFLTGMYGSIRFHKSSDSNTLAITAPPCISSYGQIYANIIPFC
jgi:hypothetical protein